MALLWALIVTLWCFLDFSTAAPTAKTKNGTYEGFHVASYNQDLFLGIPYAQRPVGGIETDHSTVTELQLQRNQSCYGILS
jgi:carboxylesterase type B